MPSHVAIHIYVSLVLRLTIVFLCGCGYPIIKCPPQRDPISRSSPSSTPTSPSSPYLSHRPPPITSASISYRPSHCALSLVALCLPIVITAGPLLRCLFACRSPLVPPSRAIHPSSIVHQLSLLRHCSLLVRLLDSIEPIITLVPSASLVPFRLCRSRFCRVCLFRRLRPSANSCIDDLLTLRLVTPSFPPSKLCSRVQTTVLDPSCLEPHLHLDPSRLP